MGKKNNKKNTAAAAAGAAPEEDEDWALLNQLAAENAPPEPPTDAEAAGAAAAAPAPEAEAGAEGGEDAAGEGEEGASSSSASKKKKKKKKDKAAAAPKPTSAAARIILERQAAKELEDRRLEAERKEHEDAENARIKAINDAKKEREDELERRRLEKAAKKQKAIDEGRYKTKAQRAKEERARQAREQLIASGQLQVPVEGEEGAAGAGGRKKVSYGDRRRPKKTAEEKAAEAKAEEEAKAAEAEAQAKAEAEAKAAAEAEEDDGLDDWENEDWENVDVDAVVQVVETPAPEPSADEEGALVEEEEDEAIIELRKEEERLRLQGLAHAQREREREEAVERAMTMAVDDSEDEDTMEEGTRAEQDALMAKLASRRRRQEAHKAALAARSADHLRSPITVIMGHVDTGKTKLLDKIRRTNVQEGEAGGITQQIGATFFPRESIMQQTAALNATEGVDMRLPGLLIIDTPGHESFTNLRSRGSTLCDFAILVIDLMHGLEPQTIESLNLLKASGAPFVVALNKVDRCYDWQICPNAPIRDALAAQPEHTRQEFETRLDQAILALNEQGLNAALYWENDDPRETISIIPTSAHSGEGVPDLLLVQYKLMQEMMLQKLMFVDSLECTVLEVKAIDGLGTTVDVVLVNGHLEEGSNIVVCTLDGPVVTPIRALLTPHPMKEMRVKGDYIHHQTMQGSMGIKISAHGLERAVAGTPVLVAHPGDDLEDLKEEVMQDLQEQLARLATDTRGVLVQASTLGALEALLEFLRNEQPPIPVSAVAIGTVHKKDVMRCSAQLEHRKEYATILAFDVRVDPEARELAQESQVRIFTADIIYHLKDQFCAYLQEVKRELQAEVADVVVFPSVLRILPQHVYNKRDPIVLGCDVVEGILKVGTPLCIPGNNMLEIGTVTGIQNNHKDVDEARKGASVCIKIHTGETGIAYGRHFNHEHNLYSHLSRESIDALKLAYRDDLRNEDWRLIINMKPVFGIM